MPKSLRLYVLALALVHSAPVVAQQPNPVLEHYRAYRAALEANDLDAAENAAEAALAASEARDGDGGRTAVLALNLAQLRLDIGRHAEALAPARRAYEIAHHRTESGVDPLLVELALGRAELQTPGLQETGKRRLISALSIVEQLSEPPLQAYDVYTELGRRAENESDWVLAHRAWTAAIRVSELYGIPPLQRARARVGASVALIGTGIRSITEPFPLETASEAAENLTAATHLLGPLAQSAPWGEGSESQALFAEAMAWRFALRSRIMTEHGRRAADETLDGEFPMEVGRPASTAPPCLLQIAPNDLAAVRQAASRSALTTRVPLVGGSMSLDRRVHFVVIILVLQINEAGVVTHAEIATSIGDAPDGSAVLAAIRTGGWRVQRHEASLPGCRMAMTAFWPYVRVPHARFHPSMR